MKNIVVASIISVAISGCATPTFFANGPFDAKPITQSISAKKIATKNTEFNVYKINGSNYAIIPSYNQATSDLSEISGALIFTTQQVDDLKKACQEIVKAYELEKNGETRIVEYHLTLNGTEMVSSSNSVISNDVFATSINTQSQVMEIQRVIFRIQFVQSANSVIGSGKRIDYRFGDFTRKISIEDVNALIEDLST
jgi:hypothetical protein